MGIVFGGNNFKVDVFRRDVRGSSQEFEVVRRFPVVLCIPVVHDGRLLLIRQNRVAVDQQVIEFPAGRLQSDEDATEGMRRELAEEAGFEVDEMTDVGTVQSAPHFCDEQVRVFLAKGRMTTARAPTPKEEIDRVFALLPSEVGSKIASGEISDCKTIAAYSVACARGLIDEAVA